MIALSYLQKVYYSRKRDLTVLHQSLVTDWDFAPTFGDAVASILANASYVAPQSNKLETFGWTPAVFMPSVNGDGQEGVWREGCHAMDEGLSLFIADLDNQHADRTMISIDEVEATLNGLGLSYLLYTSFSHKPGRHKVRIVCPVTRDLTPDEAFCIFLWFNTAFDRQLDGSIYDPGDFLYGPPLDADIRVNLAGEALDVEAYLAMSSALSDEDRGCVGRVERGQHRKATVEELAVTEAQWTIGDATEGVSIYNAHTFNPAWLPMLHQRYVGGSRHQTAMGLLTKAWIKSERQFTRGDLETLQREIDAEYGGYLRRTYGCEILEDDLRAVMKMVAAEVRREPTSQQDYDARLKRNIERITNKKKNAH
jgi:hypothetical protein